MDRIRSSRCSCLRIIALLVLGLLLLVGCAGRKGPRNRARLKEQVREVVKEKAPTAIVRVSKGTFQAADNQGRLVLVARITDADATLQPSDPSQGPVTLTKADLTLYKEGKPSLWLKAPVASWKAGLLIAPHGADSGSVDGMITLHSKKEATWTAKTDRLSVMTAACELREPGRPMLLAVGPAATWQNGLLTLPSGGTAHAVDGSASMRADLVRWRAKTHGLEATGRVRMTRGRLAGAAGRLTGDTTLRQFRLTRGRPRVTFYNQPAPLVAAAVDDQRPSGMPLPSRRDRTKIARSLGNSGEESGIPHAWFPGRKRPVCPQERTVNGPGYSRTGSATQPASAGFLDDRPVVYGRGTELARSFARRSNMAVSRSWLRLALVGAPSLLTALPMPAAHAVRSSFAFSSGSSRTILEADRIDGSPSGGAHATGKVVLTSPHGILYADNVDATPSKSTAGTSRAAVQEARATGHVRVTSQPKPDERMEATGAAGTYWPGTQKATLTGGVTVTMTSPQLQEPAVLTGAKADIDLAQRTADVTRTEAAQVSLKLHPKADSASSGSPAAGPVRLDADRIRMENAVNRITATGSPVLTGDQGTVRAEKIWFDVDPKANDVKMVHAAGSVRIDSQDAQGGTFHGKAEEAVMNRADDTVVLTGNVRGTHTRPDQPEPETLQTEVLTYNHKTGEYSMRSTDETRSRVTFKPKPKPAGSGEAGAGAAPAPPPKGKASRRRGGK